jgi:hypothetical protein
MKYLNKLLFIFFLFPLISAAQSNYRPGYVVNIKGDTIRGFIDYQAWDANPTAISFKSAISDRDKKTYTLNDISLFNVTGLATYKKYTCNISTDQTNTDHLGEGRDTSFKTETVLLKVLQQGKNLTLYSYADDVKPRFYIGEAPDYTPTELAFRLYYDLAAEHGARIVNENTYQKQLFALANKYNVMDNKLTGLFQNTNYDSHDLLAIVSSINNISKAEFEKKYAEHTKIRWYLTAALDISTTSSSAGSPYLVGGGVASTSYQPAVALGIDLIPDPVGGRVEFKADLSVHPTQFNALYPLKVVPYGEVQASYDQFSVFFTLQALFNIYSQPDFSFYLGAGAAITYSSFSNVKNPFGAGNSYEFNAFDNAFVLKAGFRIHQNYEICFDYFLPSYTTTAGGYFGLSSSIKEVGISYFFGK